MDAALFTKMLSDKYVLDLKKLGYKFPQADIKKFTGLLKNGFYHSLPLKNFSGQNICPVISFPGRRCRNAWANWSPLSMKNPRSTIC